MKKTKGQICFLLTFLVQEPDVSPHPEAFQTHHLSPTTSQLPILILHHFTQRALLYHQGHDFEQRIRRGHRRQLSVRVVCRRDLDDVCRHQIDALEAADDGAQFAGGPATRLRRSGGGGICLCISTMGRKPFQRKSLASRSVFLGRNQIQGEMGEMKWKHLQAGSRVSMSMLR